MKTIYFLRHGQTELNKRWVHQYPETMLSALGLAQAQAAADHFKDKPLDLIIYSPLMRTQQTAQKVAAHHDCRMVMSNLFEELRRPRMLWGKPWFTPHSLYVMGMLYVKAGKSNWHYSDEENLEEFHARSRRALEFLADRDEERILVVTHRGFMAGLVSRMRHDGLDSIGQYRRALWKNLTIPNCGYITATWNEVGEDGDTLDGTWSVQSGVTATS